MAKQAKELFRTPGNDQYYQLQTVFMDNGTWYDHSDKNYVFHRRDRPFGTWRVMDGVVMLKDIASSVGWNFEQAAVEPIQRAYLQWLNVTLVKLIVE